VNHQQPKHSIPADLSRVPFVPLPAEVIDLETLMAFDKSTARAFGQFRRPVHRADFPAEIARGVTAPPVQILVTELSPGIRSRVGLTRFQFSHLADEQADRVARVAERETRSE
jgi:hypothetical protein